MKTREMAAAALLWLALPGMALSADFPTPRGPASSARWKGFRLA
ncbi:hypothetical protein [Citreimonas salinaria]|nr:hypothetical protein [Citreimonas salinaria]